MDKIRSEVKRILTVSPETRADDMVLYYHYVGENFKGCTTENFATLFVNPRYRAENGIPTFASVSRMRRKLQETYAELRPSKQQQKVKREYEKKYREFYRNPLCSNCE